MNIDANNVTSTSQEIIATVRDYVDGWFDGDAERMRRALHPELVKRCRGIEGHDPDALETLSAQRMIDDTASGEGVSMDLPDRRIEITIDRQLGDIAAVTCACAVYVDLLHLIRMPDGWKIVNAVWVLT